MSRPVRVLGICRQPVGGGEDFACRCRGCIVAWAPGHSHYWPWRPGPGGIISCEWPGQPKHLERAGRKKQLWPRFPPLEGEG